jgi:hypothetical protein
MDDIKNFSLAWVSSVSTVIAVFEANILITIISAIVLPVMFFTIGKTVDVCLQIYFQNREEERNRTRLNTEKEDKYGSEKAEGSNDFH